MKILYTAVVLLISSLGHAQVEPNGEEENDNCFHNVSTDPENPSNDDMPINFTNGEFKNSFNWIPIDPQSQLYMDYNCTNMFFGGTQISNMNNIMASNLSYYDYISDGPLPLNENGWELLMVNLGRYPDDVTPLNPNTFSAMPFVVIYNRYSGILRVFFQFGLDNTVGQGADAVEVMVSFTNSNKMTGLLRLSKGQDQGLDKMSSVTHVRSNAKAPAQGSQWASTDFQLAYDPCTCYYPSDLRIDFFQTAYSDIELLGRSITLANEPLINNQNLQTNPTEFLSNYDFDDINEDANGGGLVMHKSLEKMIEDYKNKLEKYNKDLVAVNEHNAKVKKNLALLEMGLSVIRVVANPPTGILTLTPEQLAEQTFDESFSEYLGLTQQEINEKYFNLQIQNAGGWFSVVEKYYKGIVKANSEGKKSLNQKALFSAITTVLGEKGKTFIDQNFVAKEVPKKPAIPTATFTEMSFKGRILDQKDLGGPNFYTPGTYGSAGTGSPAISQYTDYPVYNEILGTFALLKSPKLKIIETSTDFSTGVVQNTTTYNTGAYNLDIFRHKNWTTDYQILLDEPLSYTFNPILDIVDYDMSVSFEVIAIPQERSNTGGDPTPNDAIINVFYDPDNSVNILADNYDVATYFPMVTNSRGINYYIMELGNSVKTSNDFSSELSQTIVQHVTGHQSEDKQKLFMDTEFVPIDALNQFRASMGIHHQTVTHKNNFFWQYDIDNGDYEYTQDANGNYIFELNNPNIQLPDHLTLGYHGYEYDFQINMKVALTIEFETLNDRGVPNTVTQMLTFPIAEDDISRTAFGAISNFYYTSGNISQFEKDLIYGNKAMNVGNTYDYQFNGQPVDGCTLNGNTYTCGAWNDITILGDIEVTAPYTVNFRAGNEIQVLPEAIVPPEVVLEIVPVLDYSNPTPALAPGEVFNFCVGENGEAPPYQANRGEAKQGIFGSPGLHDLSEDLIRNWDFLVYPNPSNAETFIILDNIGLDQVEIECYDITMKKIDLNVTKAGVDRSVLDTGKLSSGVYVINVRTYSGVKSKRLIINK
jgi:hypothetical protein